MIQILKARKVNQKINRIAIEICERHYGDEHIILAGINNNGYHFAEQLADAVRQFNGPSVQLTRISLSPAAPTEQPITIELQDEELCLFESLNFLTLKNFTLFLKIRNL